MYRDSGVEHRTSPLMTLWHETPLLRKEVAEQDSREKEGESDRWSKMLLKIDDEHSSRTSLEIETD